MPVPPGRSVKPFDAALHCGARTHQRGGLCQRVKGYGTAHLGRGRCKYHGGISKKGDRRIKTGLFSPYLQGTLKEAADHVEKSQHDLMDLTPHLKLLNIFLGHLMEERESDNGALVDWYNKFGGTVNMIINSNDAAEVAGAVAKLKAAGRIPAGRMDLEGSAKLIKDIGVLVEKMHRMKQTSSVTLESVSIYAERLLLVVFRHVKDKDILAVIKSEVARIGVDMDESHAASD